MSREPTLRAGRRRGRRRKVSVATAALVAGLIIVASTASAQQEEVPTETTAPPAAPDDPHATGPTTAVDTASTTTTVPNTLDSETSVPATVPDSTTAADETSTGGREPDETGPSTTVVEDPATTPPPEPSSTAAFSAASSGARTVTITDDGSGRLVVSPTTVDLGEIAVGAVVAETITVVNDSADSGVVLVYGFDDVVVSDVDPSCGNLDQATEFDPAAAVIYLFSGASCDIVVTLNDTTTARAVDAALWFEFGDTEQVLSVIANVVRTVVIGDPFGLDPRSVDLGEIANGVVVAETIRVVNDSPGFRELLVYGFDDVVVSGVDPSCGNLEPATAVYPAAAAIFLDGGASCDVVVTLDDTATARSVNAELWFENVDSKETDQLAVTAQVLESEPPVEEPPVDAVSPTISIAGPSQAVVGATTTVTVIARHPGGLGVVKEGFQFNLTVDFTERVLSAEPNSVGVSCVARSGESPPREFSCVSSVGLDEGESVGVTFEVSTPANEPLSPCQDLTPEGKRFGPIDAAGPVCLNVVAYPGPFDEVPINRAVVGGDAVMASIPLTGPYLRFTASATDAQPGDPVTLTVAPTNPGTGTLTGVSFSVFPQPSAAWDGVSPGGWACSLGFFGDVRCTASTLTLGAGQQAVPIQLTFTAPPVPNPTSCPVSVLPIAAPRPDPCGTFTLHWNSASPFSFNSIGVSRVAYRIGSSSPDITPPVIAITGVAPGETITSFSPTLTISADEALFDAICTLETPLPGGGTDVDEVGCLADGLLVDDLSLPDLPDGQITFTVSAADAAGNRREVSVTFFVEAPPTASISAPADGATYLPADVPASVVYQCVDNGEIAVEEVQLVPQGGGTPTLLVGPPPSSIGTHTIRVLCVDGLGEEAIASATYVVEADGSGPCLLVDTPTVDFGDITVGSTSPDRSVVVRSCSTAPITVAASVGDATTVGGGEIWLATTSTIPAANQFSWTITPAGGSTPVPVGPTRTTIGPVLAPGTTRSDAHRLRLGPAGPGLGTQFTSIITYTAFAADP